MAQQVDVLYLSEPDPHMILNRSRFGMRLMSVYYEPADVIRNLIERNDFSRMEIYSYDELTLPPTFRLTRSELTVRLPVQGISDEELLSGFRKTYRNEIRRADESSLRFVVAEGNLDRDLYEMYCSFERSQGRSVYPYSFFVGLTAFVALESDIPVSAVICIEARPVLKVFAICSLRHSAGADHTMLGWAAKRLVYDLCRFARDRDFQYADLAYIDTVRPDRAGITAFKEGFGGERIREYQYEYVSWPVRLIRRVRSLIRI